MIFFILKLNYKNMPYIFNHIFYNIKYENKLIHILNK